MVYPSANCLPDHFETSKKKDTHIMSQDNVIEIKNPEPFIDDPITEILRNGAKKLLAEALG